jgi:heme exporter protein D
MVEWAVSQIGQAVAAWLSAILSVIAIGIALVVALFEQRRGNANRLAEQVRERERREADQAERRAEERLLVRNFVTLLGKGEELAKQIYDETARSSFVDWSRSSEYPRLLIPFVEALGDLKKLWRGNSDVSLIFSSVVTLFRELVEGPESSAPSGARLGGYMGSRIQALRNHKTSLEALTD